MLKILITGLSKWAGLASWIICATVVMETVLAGTPAMAGWRIDGSRYLQSVHGDMTCRDCHEGIESLPRHPEPANGMKAVGDFFEPEKCLECHDDVRDQIETDANHGGEAVKEVRQLFNCIECHAPHSEGAPEPPVDGPDLAFSRDDGSCLACHLQIDADDPDRMEKNRMFCLSCHTAGNGLPAPGPVMDPAELEHLPHATLDCMACHPGTDRYGHKDQPAVDCRQCHSGHEERIAHDAHLEVSCQACHLDQVIPVRDSASHRVLWQRAAFSGSVSRMHRLVKPDGQGCTRCHFPANPIGAAAMVLPAKSVICMPCHPATLTARDSTTIIALMVGCIGLLGFLSVWFSATLAGSPGAAVPINAVKALGSAAVVVFSRKGGHILKALWTDAILQRRLYRLSPRRWAFHALIFWPFVIRFTWGLSALFTTSWFKQWPLAWAMIDKNHPVAAFVFDFTGLCLFLGIVLAFWRGSAADQTRMAGLPKQDRLALGLILGVVIAGFVLEGMRIAMTGARGAGAYAFVGYGLAGLFSGMRSLAEVYGYIWYAHAILTGAFLAYLPFSRMMHMIMSPVVIALNAAADKTHR